jgi:membrane-associated phospholipid phosphatase
VVSENRLVQKNKMNAAKKFLHKFPLAIGFMATCLICAGLFRFVDYPLAYMIDQNVGQGLHFAFKIITFFGNVAYWELGGFLAVILFSLAAWVKRSTSSGRRLAGQAWRAVYFQASLMMATLMVFSMKELVGRLRPPFFLHDIVSAKIMASLHDFSTLQAIIEHHEKLSFPSSHSANAFAAAVAISQILPGGRWVFLVLAVLMAISRVVLNVHYASDVVMGAFMGVMAAVLIRRWFESAGVPMALPRAARWKK